MTMTMPDHDRVEDEEENGGNHSHQQLGCRGHAQVQDDRARPALGWLDSIIQGTVAQAQVTGLKFK
jgi:hypothetical protein